MKESNKQTDVSTIRNSFWRRSEAGFTLLELMISIAIIGILTAIIFTNFSQEKDRNALKSAVHQLQTDLQAMQTNAQGGVVQGATVPKGYGLFLSDQSTYATQYVLFADLNGDGTHDNPPVDIDLRQQLLPPSVKILRLADGTSTTYNRFDIVFTAPNGVSLLKGTGVPILDSATIVIKSDKLNICYAITVTANVGTVSKRQLASSCT